MTQLRFGRSMFDVAAKSVDCDGHTIPLTAKSAELLATLLAERNGVVSSDVLRERLWPAGFVEPGNLPQQVYLLRRSLAIDPTVAIETVARSGYRLRVPDAAARPSGWRAGLRPLAASLVAAVALVVLPGGASTVSNKPPVLAGAALRSFTLGRYFWERRGEENFARAQAYFARTVALAPANPLGYAGLSEVWGLRADQTMSKRHKALARRALDYARVAVAKDEDSALAHAALGLALLESSERTPADPKHRHRTAVSELRRAIDLDPGNAEAHEWYAIQLLEDGRVAEAGQHFDTAAQLQPENVAVTTWRATMRYYLHDFSAAEADYRTALDLNPAFETAQLGLISALVQRHAYRDAKAALRDIQAHDWSTTRALQALAAIADLRLGRRNAADAEAGRLQAEARSRPGDSDEFVVAALVLDGRRVEARRLAGRMHLESDPYARRMISLDPLVGPVFRNLGING